MDRWIDVCMCVCVYVCAGFFRFREAGEGGGGGSRVITSDYMVRGGENSVICYFII